jgi:hypothetical protein
MKGPFDLHGRFELGSQAAAGTRIYNGQYLAASALLRRLYSLDEPGAILADEVGLGKTYVALGSLHGVWRNVREPGFSC